MMELLRICAKDEIIHQRNGNDYGPEILGCSDREQISNRFRECDISTFKMEQDLWEIGKACILIKYCFKVSGCECIRDF